MAKADASEAILVAAQGAEVDKRESLQVILARLDASKSQTLLSGQWLEEMEMEICRSKGNFFQTSGHLPHRDLDSWEQQKAIMPERSWSQSAMSCVRSTMGRSVLSHGDLQDGHPHGAHRRGVPDRGICKILFAWADGMVFLFPCGRAVVDRLTSHRREQAAAP
eukprot:g6532.t1